MGDVLALGEWKNNAELIADVARLGYLDGRVLDLTYGLGKFWDLFTPDELVRNDIDPSKGDHSVDVQARRRPTDWGSEFDAVVFDPPYRMSGRRDLGEFDDRYGLSVTGKDVPELLQNGVRFARWCVKSKTGYVLVKCQDCIYSGALVEQTDIVRQAGAELGLRVVDRFHLPQKGRPQRSQTHARSNYSTLMVLGTKAPRGRTNP